jgi:hypothetical protein
MLALEAAGKMFRASQNLFRTGLKTNNSTTRRIRMGKKNGL